MSASHASSFAAGTIVQKRIPSVMMRERQLQAGQSDTGNEIAKQHRFPAMPVPFVGPTVPHRVKILLKRPMSWRTVEPLAIAIVFCTMMGLSIHRLSAVPDRTSLASGVPEKQNDSQPARTTVRALASSQAVMTPNSRQSPIGGEAHIVAEDIVIRHQNRRVSLIGKPGAQLTLGRDADVFAADSVVQYGSDVTMWSRKYERAAPKIGGFSR